MQVKLYNANYKNIGMSIPIFMNKKITIYVDIRGFVILK